MAFPPPPPCFLVLHILYFCVTLNFYSTTLCCSGEIATRQHFTMQCCLCLVVLLSRITFSPVMSPLLGFSLLSSNVYIILQCRFYLLRLIHSMSPPLFIFSAPLCHTNVITPRVFLSHWVDP